MSGAGKQRLLVGVGNSGVTVLDLLAVGEPGLQGLLVVNNDPDSLTASVVRDRLGVPEGDPGEGFLDIEEKFGEEVGRSAVVILCGGLGGDTGSVLLPALAIRSKAAGIATMACVGMPFTFEGKHKRDLALQALEKLRGVCDAVVVIDNDQLSGGAPSTAAVGEAFLLSDRFLLSSLRALRGMIGTSGPVKITRTDLHSVLGVHDSVTHFAFGSSSGSNRLHEALERALKSPLLSLHGKGSALKEAKTVLLYLQGPSDLSFAEVQLAVEEIERIAGEKCQIKVGVQSGGSLEVPLELFMMTSSGGTAIQGRKHEPQPVKKTPIHQVDSIGLQRPEPETLAPVPVPAAVSSGPAPGAKNAKPVGKSGPKQTQGTLDLDTYQRGRFDKSEPTIVGGEDLDIPTFLRKGIKLNTLPKR